MDLSSQSLTKNSSRWQIVFATPLKNSQTTFEESSRRGFHLYKDITDSHIVDVQMQITCGWWSKHMLWIDLKLRFKHKKFMMRATKILANDRNMRWIRHDVQKDNEQTAQIASSENCLGKSINSQKCEVSLIRSLKVDQRLGQKKYPDWEVKLNEMTKISARKHSKTIEMFVENQNSMSGKKREFSSQSCLKWIGYALFGTAIQRVSQTSWSELVSIYPASGPSSTAIVLSLAENRTRWAILLNAEHSSKCLDVNHEESSRQ
jgi:hypothetical protein